MIRMSPSAQACLTDARYRSMRCLVIRAIMGYVPSAYAQALKRAGNGPWNNVDFVE